MADVTATKDKDGNLSLAWPDLLEPGKLVPLALTPEMTGLDVTVTVIVGTQPCGPTASPPVFTGIDFGGIDNDNWRPTHQPVNLPTQH